jgi:hypothetical protein
MKEAYKTDPEDITKVYISEFLTVPRYIVCAANLFVMPEGTLDIVVCGTRHHDPIMRRVLDHLKELHPEGSAHGDQGFVDQYQQWVSRKDATTIVLANGQALRDIPVVGDDLFSENLY